MKKYKITLLVGILIFLNSSIYAQHLSLEPTSMLPIKESRSLNPSSVALKFDISAIPKDTRIDLAELRITIDTDSTLGKIIHISVHAALSEWTASLTPREETISKSDTLVITNYLAAGDNKSTEFNVSDLVQKWHSGKLSNNGFVLSILNNIDKKMIIRDEGSKPKVELSIYYSK